MNISTILFFFFEFFVHDLMAVKKKMFFKKNQIFLKKYLTNGKKCDIIIYVRLLLWLSW